MNSSINSIEIFRHRIGYWDAPVILADACDPGIYVLMSWLARSFLIVAIRMSHVAANCGNKAKGDGELLNPPDILLRICYFMGEPGG